MQTFLPYSNFAKSAQVLDNRRLGKQRVEAKQIYLALTQPGYGWQNHPAVKMWRGHTTALAIYGVEICAEWTRRGYRDSLMPWFSVRCDMSELVVPLWLGDESFHLSHQSNLVRKDHTHYRPYFPSVPDNLPYVWPTSSAIPGSH